MEGWLKVYESVDAISPWTVRRYVDEASADAYARDVMSEDIRLLKSKRIEYVPTVFPGFSVGPHVPSPLFQFYLTTYHHVDGKCDSNG